MLGAARCAAVQIRGGAPDIAAAVAGRHEGGAVDGQSPCRADERVPQPAQALRQRAVLEEEPGQLLADAHTFLGAVEIRVQDAIDSPKIHRRDKRQETGDKSNVIVLLLIFACHL